ncbi:methyl-accepting chemotaxis protein [Roseateles albus]|uniref:Methyl-accepting chemotaxis protein n=1 Tax=Roseateles albus TaxID=2987525 RepID=A0ABT5KC58_9BURK|nr:methyl-accepting chemotaxis protein [Roseateles albus]MDC8771513.1 methyl-accepting chemotaxis protein [Roseateles albus]
MNLLTKLRISQRLAVSYGLLILLLVAIGSYGAGTASHLAKDLDHTANISLVKIASANGLEGQVNVIARASRDLLLLDEARQIKKQKAAIEGALQESEKQLSALEASLDGSKEKELISQVRANQAKFFAAVAKFQKIQKDGSPDEARESLITDVRPAQQSYQDGLKGLVDLQFDAARDLAVSGGELARSSVLLTAVLVAVAAVIGIGGGLVIARSIVLPAQQAQAAAEAIAAGDLTQVIQAHGQDELSQMLRAMQEMQRALSGVVNSVSEAAGEVVQNSSDIADSNVNLSDRTARSAASLQNTAASVEQIAANLNGASDLTRRAAGIATKARQSATAGGAVVSKVVATMEDISASSKKIGDIIGVIDGIAFQTNILALNAAVEAARAGEHGRGFAVVASEVRALASRSASAAKEIKVLIQESSVKVENGTALVNNAGITIRSVVDEVNNMGQLIEEISHSAHEQAAGVGVVNNAMNELDRATQQNTTLVDDLGRSTDALKNSSSRLLDAVGFFRAADALA